MLYNDPLLFVLPFVIGSGDAATPSLRLFATQDSWQSLGLSVFHDCACVVLQASDFIQHLSLNA